MERTKPYTERELDVLTEAETQLRTNGLDLSDTSLGSENGQKLRSQYESMFGDAEVSLANVYAAVKSCPGLVWKSSEQMGYEKLARQVDPNAIDGLIKVIRSYKLKDSFKNRLQILQFVLARNLHRGEQGFALAVTNLIARPGSPLEFVETPVDPNRVFGRHSGKKFAQDEANVKDEQYSAGRLNHARTPQQQSPRQVAQSRDQEFKAKAEGVKGHTHNKTAEIQRCFIYKNDGGVDWVATFAARERIADGRRGSI